MFSVSRNQTDSVGETGSWTERAGQSALLWIPIVAWAWFPVIAGLTHRWNSDDRYSHGWFVPLIAIWVCRLRSAEAADGNTCPAKSGYACLTAAGSLYIVGALLYSEWLEQISLIPLVAGIVLLSGGVRLFRISWPGILYLLFMIPLPYRLESDLAQPLQSVAGAGAAFSLRTLGLAAIRTGNLIHVEGTALGVAEACSGMRVLMVFFAMSAAYALLTDRSWFEKCLLVFAAVPIALVCNILRITITGCCYVWAGPEAAEGWFHDAAGWLMMLPALLLLAGFAKYLDVLLSEPSDNQAADRSSRELRLCQTQPEC